MGDWIQLEQAWRIIHSRHANDIRLIEKYYFIDEGETSFHYALALEAIFEVPISALFSGYSATYLEYIKGNEWQEAGLSATVPDLEYFYQHFGIRINGKHLDLNIFTSLSHGNGKGKLVLERSRAWGWGLKVTLR